MQRSSLLLAVLSCLAPAASAQAQDIMVTVRDFTGRTTVPSREQLGSSAGFPITQMDCDTNAEITFRFDGIDTTRTNLYLYQGASCDDVMIRNTTTDERCSELAGPFMTEMRRQVDLTIGVEQLVPCGAGGGGTITVWVLAVNNTMSDEVSGAGQKATFDVAYDFEGPAAPPGFDASGGETSITVEWEAGSDQVTRYEVYVDPNGCMDGAVDPEGALASDPDNPPMSLLATTIDGPSSGGPVPFPESVPTPGEAAVAVRAVDRAGNVGALSPVRCVARFEVTSWLEMYCVDGSADACGGSDCSVSPGSGSTAPLVALGLVVGVALLRRRRR